jgi:WD40 repeat protein
MTAAAAQLGCAYVVPGGRDRTARVWDVATSTCIMVLTEHDAWCAGGEIPPCGMLVMTAGEDCVLRVFDVLNGACQRRIRDAAPQLIPAHAVRGGGVPQLIT